MANPVPPVNPASRTHRAAVLPSLTGRTLGERYAVECEVGTGAMGTVYRARQIELGTLVAVKVLHPRLTPDANLVQRFEREALAMSRLDHPNALRVLDFGKDGDLLYLVTEFFDGEDLLALLETAFPLEDARIVGILSQVLAALTAVHDVGIVHRDLKPENILVLTGTDDDGRCADIVKVCDFGIAKVARSTLLPARAFARRLTAEGVVVGTPEYMSPEQARGRGVDHRTDLYAVGIVLYELLAGRTPFVGENPVAIALQQLQDEPLPPSHHRPVHAGLEKVCLRALSKRPEDRFQSAREMRTALRDALSSPPTALVRLPPPMLPARRVAPTIPALATVRHVTPHSVWRDGRGADRGWRYALVGSAATVVASAFLGRGIDASPPRADAAVMLEAPQSALIAEAESSPLAISASSPRASTDETKDAYLAPPLEAAPVKPSSARPLPARAPEPRAAPARSQVMARPEVRRVIVVPPIGDEPSASVQDAPILVRTEPWANEATARPPGTAPSGDARERTPVATPRITAPAAEDPSRASLQIGNVTTSAGISGAKVKIALAHVPLLDCYRQALRARSSAGALETELGLVVDLGGRVVGVTLSRDAALPGFQSCIAEHTRGVQIRDVDTGDGSATVQLRFSPR
jgi:serine/threonine protein kinase